MFINKSDIEKVKQYSIIDYLSSKGIQPLKEIGKQMLYYSPLTNEKTASFLVEPTKNVFNDYSSGQKGDIIRLVGLIEKLSFYETFKLLSVLKTSVSVSSFSFSGNSNKQLKMVINSVQPVSNKSLIQYIENRGIAINLGKKYLSEVHFNNNGKNYFAVGFQNISGGYELRNPLGFKGKTANGITLFDKKTNKVNLFEGFFDFLSALQYYNCDSFKNTTVILNTNNNLQSFLNTLSNYQVINSFLDNDTSGRSTYYKIANLGFEVYNQSEIIYPNSKDFNDFILNKPLIVT
jgi:DNA primase